MENLPALIVLPSILALGYLGAPLWVWTLVAALPLSLIQVAPLSWAIFGVIAALFNFRTLRRNLITRWILTAVRSLGLMPRISDTERVALKAGDVWVEGELFSGKPDLRKLISESYPTLTAEEQAFVDGPVEKLCSMIQDWKVWQDRDLPPEAWEWIKKERFFGMVVPKEYGGLGFSALAHSEVLAKLASRSLPVCITVMVPNSLGPAELLIHYGTEEQKRHYLPRLAKGEEIPCFGLTEPGAGSDAASIQASGVVFKGDDGKLYLRLNWNKRWITLAAVSTVIGVAFRLQDPEQLLGKGAVDLGITCALIPSNTPGVTANRRHDPLGVPFYNCPTQGKDVVVPVEAIIGGVERAGQGWQMLMECLAAGRGISLPAQATGGAKTVGRIVSAHATVRKQFGTSIGKFEGIVEPLARIAGYTYLMEGARRYTLGGLDRGAKPPVVTAIAKYNFTELERRIVNDGMDILGGQGISRGPRNLLANSYIATPIAITVEGANILTRTLIIFGQGALRAHPYAYAEVEAAENNDLAAFDRAFWSHIGHVIRNGFRAALLSLTRGRLALAPASGPEASYWRKLAWTSAVFAFMADLAMATLGAQLKMKEKITGRFADILSWMYLATGTLKRFEAEGRRKEDLPLLHWSMRESFNRINQAFEGIFSNMGSPPSALLFWRPLLALFRLNPIGRPPSDGLDLRVAALCQIPGEQRERLFGNVFKPANPEDPLNQLEEAFHLTIQSEAAGMKVRKAIKAKKLVKKPAPELYRDALSLGILTQDEFDSIDKAEEARSAAIQVDDFGLAEYKGLSSAT